MGSILTRFRPRPLGVVLTAILVPVLCSLGLWQIDRAGQKRDLRQAFRERGAELELRLAGERVDADMVQFAYVTVTGRYDARHLFYLANRVHDRQVGFHVITPLGVDGGETRVLVNRGWVPQGADSPEPPGVETPDAPVTVRGRAIVPDPNVFAQAFEPQDGGAGPRPVRSVLDMRELDAAMPFPIQPFVVLLHPEAEAGGFVREWPQLDRHPDLMPERNLSYAVQWFAMAAAVLVIFVITALRRPPEETLPDVKDGKE